MKNATDWGKYQYCMMTKADRTRNMMAMEALVGCCRGYEKF